MKKRSILVSIAAISAMTLSFAACDFDIKNLFGNKEQEHTHTFSEVWSKDATNHWHAATCTDTDDCASQTSDLAAHTYTDGECTVCGYEQAITPPPGPVGPVEGSEENPIVFTVPGSLTLDYVPNENNDSVWYTFTAAESATLGVTLSNNAVMCYGVDKAAMVPSTSNYVEVEITAGTVYYANFSTSDFSAGQITATAAYVEEQGIGDLSGTYNFKSEWGTILVIEIDSNDDNLGGSVVFNGEGYTGPVTLNYTYAVVEDAIVVYDETGAETGEYGAKFFVENGVVSAAYYDGWDYELYVPKAPSGFEGKYDAVSDQGSFRIVITPDDIEIFQEGRWGMESIGVSEYSVVDGQLVVDPAGAFAGMITFTVEDGVIVSMTESNLGTFAVSVYKEPTGFEGEYTFENNFGNPAEVVVTTDDITVTAYGDTFTSTYTVDENGQIVVDPEGEFADFIAITVVDGEITGIDFAGEVFGPARGSEANPIAITLSESDMQATKLTAYEPMYYTFTATETGLLTVSYAATDKGYATLTDPDYVYYQSNEGQTFTFEIVSGVSYTLTLSVSEDITSARPTMPVTLSFNAQALPVEGDFEKAYEIEETYEDRVCEFPETEDAEKYVWYKFVNYYGGSVIVTFRSNVNVKHGLSKDALTALEDVSELRFTAQADTSYYFGIQTKDLVAGQVAFAVNHILPQGMSEENPYAIDNDTTSYSYAGNWVNHIYAYTPMYDGTATITITKMAANIYTSDYAIETTAYMDTPKPIELVADQTIYISLNATDENAVTGSITIEFARKIVLTGFEGAYTATTDNAEAMVPTYDVEFTSTEIIVSFTGKTVITNAYEYKLVDGVPTIVGDVADYTFTVADGKLATMVDQGGIVYTIAPVIPEGVKENPIKLTFDADANGSLIVGGDTIKNDNHVGKGYTYYAITPSVSGTFTITLSTTENAVVVIDNAGVTSAHFKADTTYIVAIGVLNESNDAPTATFTFVKDEEVAPPTGEVAIQYGTYKNNSASMIFTVEIDADKVTVKKAFGYNPNNPTTVVNGAAYTLNDDYTITITGTTDYSLKCDANGNIVELINKTTVHTMSKIA